jgi:nucleoside-diphosphate-sugar epimerase
MEIKIKNMKKIFITGGAGYIGTTLIPLLLEKGNFVTVYDSLIFNNGDKLLPFMTNKNFNFVFGDIRDEEKIKKHIGEFDIVIHLAALVGFPICREKGYDESYDINVVGTEIILKNLKGHQYLIYGSTGSNYGEVTDVCTEETPLNPLSIYGKTKTIGEQKVLERENSTAFRFATAFGVSPRLRLDLLVNDLTYKIMKEGYAVIYEPHFMRTFIHVKDIARVFMFAIENQNDMKNNVYNVGSNSMNFSKKQVCELIQKYIPESYFNFADVGQDADKRNYVVSYEKINKLGFETSVSLDEGIQELIKTIPLIRLNNPYFNVLK